jgi:hypothetical protein
LPILGLVAQGDIPPRVGNIVFRNFPLTLGDLDASIAATIATRKALSA